MPQDTIEILKYENTLPEDFDGVFRFTNWTDKDFVGIWNGKEYHFPARTTSPILMTDQTPLEIQHIRKKFAKQLAELAFYNSKEYIAFRKQELNTDGSARHDSFKKAATYDLKHLTPYIQRCLEPLPVSRAAVREASRAKIEDALTRDINTGDLVSVPVDTKTSLKEKAFKNERLTGKE